MRPQDKMSLLEFATDVHERTPFTNKVSQIDRGLGQLHGGEATALYDAIYLGSQKLGPQQGRKVLVLVSDGGDTAKSTTYAGALEQALRNEVMIYSLIDVPIEASAGPRSGRRTRADHPGRADRRQELLCELRRTGQGLCAGERRSAHTIPAGLLSRAPGAGTNFHRMQVTIPRAAADAFNIRHQTGYYMTQPGKGN